MSARVLPSCADEHQLPEIPRGHIVSDTRRTLATGAHAAATFEANSAHPAVVEAAM